MNMIMYSSLPITLRCMIITNGSTFKIGCNLKEYKTVKRFSKIYPLPSFGCFSHFLPLKNTCFISQGNSYCVYFVISKYISWLDFSSINKN